MPHSAILPTGASLEYTLSTRSSFPATSNSPTLIFLHFWGGSSSTSHPTIRYLSSTYSCLSISFRGWGSSSIDSTSKPSASSNPESYSLELLAADIQALILALKIYSYVLVGHSMGGKVAQLLAGTEPCRSSENLKGLVLVAPASATPYIMPEDMKAQQLLAYTSAESASLVTRNVLTSPLSKLGEDVIESLAQDMIRGTIGAKEAWPKFGMLEDVSDAAAKIAVPVLVVGATEDRVEPIDRLREEVMKSLPRSKKEVAVLAGSGHLIPVEAPEKLAELIVEFLKELP
jgi:3-oxoadipate enol-lactonase